MPKQSHGGRVVFSTGATGKTGYAHGWGDGEGGTRLILHLIPHTKINFRWIINLNEKTINFKKKTKENISTS